MLSETDAAFSPTLKYTGKYLDPLTGQQYNWHRWYAPRTGTWLSRDPLGFTAGDANLSRYVGNGPTIATDPNGLQQILQNGVIKDYPPEIAAQILANDPNARPVGIGPPLPELRPYLPQPKPQYPPHWPPSPHRATPDIIRAFKVCGGDIKCRKAMDAVLKQIADTPLQSFYARTDDKCFKWVDDFLNRNYPNYDRSGDGTITLEEGAVTLEPLELDTKNPDGLVTYRNRLNLETGRMTGHGVVRVTVNSCGKDPQVLYFDLGSSTDLGNYGGDDHLFFPYEPGLGFEVEMDIDKARPYFPSW